NWTIATNNLARIRNEGSGTLTITGSVTASGGGITAFEALLGDFDLQGVLSGDDYTFDGNAGRLVTLGDANSYTGLTSIRAITARAGSLADAGVVSSLGTGSAIDLQTGGTLSY